MPGSILAGARSLFLCDYHVGYSDGKVDLYGIFNGIRPAEFPHVQAQFCIFAQLVNGLGRVPFFIDIRFARSATREWSTAVRELTFPSRTTVVQLALTIEGCRFEQPGEYLIELYCGETWICDTQLLLL